MSVAIEPWLKDAIIHTPGAEREVAYREFILTVREFARLSLAFRERITDDIVADQASYTLVTADSPATEVVQIKDVIYNGRPLIGITDAPAYDDSASGSPMKWSQGITADTVILWPTPHLSYTGGLDVRAAVTVAEDATVVPDEARSQFYDAIMDGFIGRMMGHPAKPYSNPQLAQYHLQRFRAGIGYAAGKVKSGFISGQNWQFPSFAK